ncbi:MAG: hypothetical protein LLF92_01775 [Planctomycetaceae bacterium]|nr:hypothetical protein [Planctomycetaceae bacterium]
MSILAINLKHLYQRIHVRLLWLGFIGSLVPIIIFAIKGGTGIFEGVLIWCYLFGLFTASIPVEIITKPFAFCLPGHHKIPVKYLFSICFAVEFLFLIIFLFYPAPNFADILTTAFSMTMAGTMLYWLGAWVVFRFPSWTATIGFIGLSGLSREFNIPEIIKYIIVKEWLAIIFAGVFVNVLAYLHWNKNDIARKYCGRFWLSFFDAWNKQRIKIYTESKIAAKKDNWKISPALEAFFIKRITNAGPNFERYIWGSLYQAFALFFSQRKWGAISFVITMSIWLGICYMSRGIGNILFVIPGIIMIQAYLPIHSPMLINGGRRERFWALFVVIVADTILIMLLTSGLALLTKLIAPIMPALTVSNEVVRFNPLDIRLFFIPLFIIPLMMALRLLLHKIPVLMMFTAIIVFTAVWAATMAFFTATRKNITLPYVNPLSIICLIVIAWLIFVVVLRRVCLKRNLI